VHEGRYDDAWALLSFGHKNLFAELRDSLIGHAQGTPRDFDHEASLIRAQLPANVKASQLASRSPRAFYAKLMEMWSIGESFSPAVQVDTAHTDAVAWDSASNFTAALVMEDGSWRVEALAGGRRKLGDVVRWRTVSGRVVSTFPSLVQREDEAVPLPRLPASGQVEETSFEVAVVVHEDGRISRWGRGIPKNKFPDFLRSHASLRRDFSDQVTPSLVRLVLKVHRDAPWAAVQGILDLCAMHDLRMHKVLFAVQTGHEESSALGAPGVAVALKASVPRRVRQIVPTIRVRIVESDRKPDGVHSVGSIGGLVAWLDTMREQLLTGGVDLEIHGETRTEEALSVIVAAAALGAPNIVVQTPGQVRPRQEVHETVAVMHREGASSKVHDEYISVRAVQIVPLTIYRD
jgi:hypothetical protein